MVGKLIEREEAKTAEEKNIYLEALSRTEGKTCQHRTSAEKTGSVWPIDSVK